MEISNHKSRLDMRLWSFLSIGISILLAWTCASAKHNSQSLQKKSLLANHKLESSSNSFASVGVELIAREETPVQRWQTYYAWLGVALAVTTLLSGGVIGLAWYEAYIKNKAPKEAKHCDLALAIGAIFFISTPIIWFMIHIAATHYDIAPAANTICPSVSLPLDRKFTIERDVQNSWSLRYQGLDNLDISVVKQCGALNSMQARVDSLTAWRVDLSLLGLYDNAVIYDCHDQARFTIKKDNMNSADDQNHSFFNAANGKVVARMNSPAFMADRFQIENTDNKTIASFSRVPSTGDGFNKDWTGQVLLETDPLADPPLLALLMAIKGSYLTRGDACNDLFWTPIAVWSAVAFLGFIIGSFALVSQRISSDEKARNREGGGMGTFAPLD